MYIPTIYSSKKGLFTSIINDTVNYYYLLQKLHVQNPGGGGGKGGSAWSMFGIGVSLEV